ncbi:hypothetical protein ACIQTN_33820 [Streptomyces werraensis]|uniref:hypothetical protein n=1 Tax=Streptomyces werraensis TaxID=68284 RepID=UPI00381F233B
MTLHRAVCCDTDGCIALYVAAPQLGPDAALYAAERAGWEVRAAGLSTRCPCCARGGLPVLERGECPVCGGSTYAAAEGDRCHHCGHVLPAPPDWGEDTDEDQDDEAAVPTGTD